MGRRLWVGGSQDSSFDVGEWSESLCHSPMQDRLKRISRPHNNVFSTKATDLTLTNATK